MILRNIEEKDFYDIIPVINDWWGGRQMADMLPKLFFLHFQSTSFLMEENGSAVGFLIGFCSQSKEGEAYIHFVGVHPEYRTNGIARRLYETFFAAVQEKGCHTVRCVTSPVNRTSIQFHRKMGFDIEAGAKEIDGIAVTPDYDGNGNDRVLFVKRL
ncbi:N-acetyltransferase family protein [Brevibacillus fluminis]|uniref:GNAT family N-acetyltransferase n=1 Tax=Brevibacillus fluminis TaxID=511487 RepID=UPI003F8C2CAB